MQPQSVHPVAELFPMMSDDELADLAEDIKANGLLYPIVVDADGQLIDGRNRLRACEIAEVEPHFETFSGDDPTSYILSANIQRRHLSKGQAAMIAVMAVSETDTVIGRTQRTRLAEQAQTAVGRIAQAVMVLHHAPDLVGAVASSAMPLDKAYAEAQQRKGRAQSIETQLEQLRAEAPDFADMVIEERMTLGEAFAALKERKEERRKDVTIVSDRLSKAIKTELDSLSSTASRARIIDLFSDDQSYLGEPLTRAIIAEAAANLTALAKEWPR